MQFYYDPTDRRCKSSVGGFPRGSKVTFRIGTEDSGEACFSADVCYFVLYRDGEEGRRIPMKRTKEGFELTLIFHEVGLYFYFFAFSDTLFLGRGALRRAIVTERPESWQITVYSETYETPHWFLGSVMYQIFPDRFHKSGEYPIAHGKVLRRDWGGCPSFRPNERGKVLNNDFFGGNFNGITEKLDYLRSLHVNVLYLNPIFEAYSNHRYDTGDFMKLDPLLGTDADFDRLVKEAEKRGIRILLDGVFNHTGDDSRYFNRYGTYDSLGAYQSPHSPYAEWYTFHEFPASYDSWWGIETLPAVREDAPSYREFICGKDGVVRTWLRRGIGGFRLDVADELPDRFLREIRTAIKDEDPDALIIGEVWEDASNKISYDERREYLQGYELDSVMNYPLKDAIVDYLTTGNCASLRETMRALVDNYPKSTLHSLMNVLGTHDTARILTVLGGKHCATKEEMAVTFLDEAEKARAKQKLKAAAVLLYTLPGVPCVYYGDEVGMEGYGDPFCRACFPWDDMDTALEAFYRTLGEIRRERFPEVFGDGEYREIFADQGCLIFERRKNEASVAVLCNNSATEYRIETFGRYREELSGEEGSDVFLLRPNSYAILAKIK